MDKQIVPGQDTSIRVALTVSVTPILLKQILILLTQGSRKDLAVTMNFSVAANIPQLILQVQFITTEASTLDRKIQWPMPSICRAISKVQSEQSQAPPSRTQ